MTVIALLLITSCSGREGDVRSAGSAVAYASDCVTDSAVLSTKNQTITIAEFSSDQEMVLCPLPACRHNDESCFAYRLGYIDSAQSLILAGDSLYYNVIVYEPDKPNPFVVEFRKSKVDGSQTKTIGRVERDDEYMFCYAGRFEEGYIVFTLERKNADDYSPEIPVTRQFAIVDTAEDTFTLLPEQSGYSNSFEVMAIQNKRLYYQRLYYTEPVDFRKLSTPESVLDLLIHQRLTIYEVDLTSATEKVWNESIHDLATWKDNMNTGFIGTPEGVLKYDPLPGYQYAYTFQPWNLSEPERTIDIPAQYTPVRYGSAVLLRATDEGDTLYYPADDTFLSLIGTPLEEYLITSVTRDKLLMARILNKDPYETDEQTMLYWIALDDVKAGRYENIQKITLIEDSQQ
jgi:hypothetical protein